MKGGREKITADRKFALVAGAIFLSLIFILLSFGSFNGHDNTEEAKITLVVMFSESQVSDNSTPTLWQQEGGKWVCHEGSEDAVVFQNISGNTVFDVLQQACSIAGWELEYQNYSYGRLVVSVNGYANGNNSTYWQYWVNGEYGTVSADSRDVSTGDTVLWRYTSSYYGKGA